MASVTGYTAEAIRRMFSSVDKTIAEKVSALETKLSGKAPLKHNHDSIDVLDAHSVLGVDGDSAYSGRLVRLGEDGRMFINTKSISEDGNPTNKQYVDRADSAIRDSLYMKGPLTASSVLNDLGPGLYTVPFTSIATALDLPEGKIGFLRVIWLDTAGIYRRYIWETDTPTSTEQWRSTYWNGNRQSWYNASGGVHQYSGSGFPEGRVSAAVGSTYVDNDATNGAVRWIKVSGTGNTGWVVEYGDTGRKDLTHLLEDAGESGRVTLSRVNDMVTMELYRVPVSGTSYNRFNYLPDGYRSDFDWQYLAVSDVGDSEAKGPIRIGTRDEVIIYGIRGAQWVTAAVTYRTRDQWPTE